jgi:hypothetical protein
VRSEISARNILIDERGWSSLTALVNIDIEVINSLVRHVMLILMTSTGLQSC